VEEGLKMSQKDINRHHVIRNVLDGRVSPSQAGLVLGLSNRQIRRLCCQVREQGAKGIIHRLRGRPSNHQLDAELLGKALSALHDPLWEGFGPTFTRDTLADCHGIALSSQTVRRWMARTGLWEIRGKGSRHRSWRERRPCRGMLTQLDGSDHDWFEGRGPRCVLLLYIDDATSDILYGEFVAVEDTMTLMRTTRTYLKRWGRPVAFYVDRDSIYKINRQATVDEELRDEQPMTQFARAMAELGIEIIWANSPQAKGRVERSFQTHQDRLVKELRLRGISDMTNANQYLWAEYIPRHNQRYAVAAGQAGDAHRPLGATHKLEQILSLRSDRTLGNDYTLRYRNRLFQVLEQQVVRIRPGEKVEMEIRLDGSLHVRGKGVYLDFKSIAQRPYQPFLVAQPSAAKPRECPAKGVGSTPAQNHPWRRFFLHGPYRVTLPPLLHAGPS